MSEQQFEQFKEKWYQKNPYIPGIDTQDVNEDVVNDIFRTTMEVVFDILKEYNNETKKQVKS